MQFSLPDPVLKVPDPVLKFARPSSQIGQTQFSNTVIVLIDKPNKKIFYNIRMIYIGDKIDAALLLPLQFKGKGGRDRNAY